MTAPLGEKSLEFLSKINFNTTSTISYLILERSKKKIFDLLFEIV